MTWVGYFNAVLICLIVWLVLVKLARLLITRRDARRTQKALDGIDEPLKKAYFMLEEIGLDPVKCGRLQAGIEIIAAYAYEEIDDTDFKSLFIKLNIVSGGRLSSNSLQA